jgi:hypothetical protein
MDFGFQVVCWCVVYGVFCFGNVEIGCCVLVVGFVIGRY